MKIRILFILLSFYFLSGVALAEEQEINTEIPVRITTYKVSYTLNEDGTHSELRTIAYKILQERALESSKKMAISFSTSVETAEIVEAFTLKADGRKIEVPKGNFQLEVNSGAGKGNPAFSDTTSLSFVFPEVEVGDTVSFTEKKFQKEPIFPGYFNATAYFPKVAAYDDVQITIDVPKKTWFQKSVRQMTEKTTEKGDRSILELTFKNENAIKTKRRNYSIYDSELEPGFNFSTFKNYNDVVEAYGVRARPKVVVSERIKKLAETIIAGKKDEKEQTRELYNWVSKNITYAGNCIGVGSVVPRDLDFVLDNKMGDCKDHATLLQTLLKAKGIESTQALVNADVSYKLSSIPSVESINHVINYIPKFDLFLDSTAQNIPFGYLPLQVSGKPVLLVDNFKEGVKTPVIPIGQDFEHSKSTIKINADGSAKIELEVRYGGLWAARSRSRFKDITADEEERHLLQGLQNMGFNGKGSFKTDDRTVVTDSFGYKASVEVKNFLKTSGAGALNVTPILPTESPVRRFMAERNDEPEKVNVLCSSALATEEFTIEFPKTRKILSIPDDSEDSNPVITYRAKYKQKGNILTVKREFIDKTPGNICTPVDMAQEREFMSLVIPKYNQQILYK